LVGIHSRAKIRRLIQPGSQLHSGRLFRQPFHQRILDRRVRENARGGRAALARRAERASGDGGGGLVEIGVGHDDHGVLTAHLAGHLLALPRRLGVDRDAD